MVIDVRRSSTPYTRMNIQGLDIEIVDSLKNLGVDLRNWIGLITPALETEVLWREQDSSQHLLRHRGGLNIV